MSDEDIDMYVIKRNGLPEKLSAVELTNELVSLIGKMYYGADEVEALAQ